ncbi:TIGR04222 domain-containing membrane protein [Streptomyces bullii]|uniref:TIGR04222 domain-containing membrane protein n=1 Tax=Streptomyces bullii TaxID=349910 RepID=A0ABW0UVW7_9ACTN
MNGETPLRLRPFEIALLRGGPRAAVTVAVIALHLRGAVEAGRPGTVRAVRSAPDRAGEAGVPGAADADGPPQPLPALADAVLACLQEPAGPQEVSQRAEVRIAVAELRVGLAEAGLLRLPLLGPTRAARRQVRALRQRHPLPASRRHLSEDDKLLAVALHGEAALALLEPRFALRTGLIPRVQVADRGLLRHVPRGYPVTGDRALRHRYSCGGGDGGTD